MYVIIINFLPELPVQGAHTKRIVHFNHTIFDYLFHEP